MKCPHLEGIECRAPNVPEPSHCISLQVGDKANSLNPVSIRACRAAGNVNWQVHCTGYHDMENMSLTLVQGPDGEETPWLT